MRNELQTFLNSEDGSLSLETAIVFPLLLWVFGATFLFWDLYHTKAVSQRAAFTVADALSRVSVVDAAYMDGLMNIHNYLLQGRNAQRMRISTIGVTQSTELATDQTFCTVWSYSPSNMPVMDDTLLNSMKDRIPNMRYGTVAIVVEAQVGWIPFLWVGIGPTSMDNFVVTRPRYDPQLVYIDGGGVQHRYPTANCSV